MCHQDQGKETATCHREEGRLTRPLPHAPGVDAARLTSAARRDRGRGARRGSEGGLRLAVLALAALVLLPVGPGVRAPGQPVAARHAPALTRPRAASGFAPRPAGRRVNGLAPLPAGLAAAIRRALHVTADPRRAGSMHPAVGRSTLSPHGIPLQQARLTAADGAANDGFGYSVALSGDTALVGAFNKTINGNLYQGAAYVFVRGGTTWTQQARLTAADGAREDHFGYSVALSGDTALVGAPGKRVNENPYQGAAYVFVRGGTTWTPQANLTAADGTAYDHFGSSVALSGDTALVGALDKTVNGNSYQGAAYVLTGLATLSATPTSVAPRVRAAGYAFAGSLLPDRWTPAFHAAHPRVPVRFAPASSAAAIAALAAGQADLALRSGPLAARQLAAEAAACPAGVLHLPLAVNAVGVAYDLPGLRPALRLTPAALAALFLGRITRWDDPRLRALNPGVALPALAVRVVYRRDGARATALLRAYLTAEDAAWRAGPGDGPRVRWPVGTGATGAPAEMAALRGTPGTLGYLDLPDARAAGLPTAAIRDRAGADARATTAGAAAAAQSVSPRAALSGREPAVLDGAAAGAYPLAHLILADLCRARGRRDRQGQVVAQFARYVLTDGQAALPGAGYAALPPALRAAALAALGGAPPTPCPRPPCPRPPCPRPPCPRPPCLRPPCLRPPCLRPRPQRQRSPS